MTQQIEKHGGELETIAEQYGIDINDLIDFSVNVNPLGPPALVVDAINKGFALLNRYPDSSSRRMRRKLASYLNLSAENIIIGNGATELIYLISRYYREEINKPNAVIVAPTFSDYQRSVSLVGGQVRHHLLSSEGGKPHSAYGFQLDIDRLIADAIEAEILFICSPNNPTGQLFPKSQIVALTTTLKKTLIVVDEAFLDFTDEPHHNSVCEEVINLPNLIVLRSMTKLFAIPGLRLGYLVAHQNLVEYLNQYKEPWTVNIFAQIAGEMLLDETAYVRKTQELVKAERKFLFNQLKQLSWLTPFPSAANFLLVHINREDLPATILREKLMKKGILIRNCSNFVGLDEQFFRIAVKKHDENLKLISALQAVESTGGLRT
ncbi:threonine-phosphate decarboxylase [Candidatus Poribacteria bacterium]|nr:threonine-phosphate decarboxylase [Candidatus Poribacteria bacterium]